MTPWSSRLPLMLNGNGSLPPHADVVGQLLLAETVMPRPLRGDGARDRFDVVAPARHASNLAPPWRALQAVHRPPSTHSSVAVHAAARFAAAGSVPVVRLASAMAAGHMPSCHRETRQAGRGRRLQKGIRTGERTGRQKEHAGEVLLDQLAERFARVSDDVTGRVRLARVEELKVWSRAVLRAPDPAGIYAPEPEARTPTPAAPRPCRVASRSRRHQRGERALLPREWPTSPGTECRPRW